MAERACSVRGCPRPHSTRGYCSGHYQRLRSSGTTVRSCATCGADTSNLFGGGRKYCSVGCGARPRAASDMRNAAAWTGGRCVVCDVRVSPGSGRRKHCSDACQVLDSAHRGRRPQSIECVACGREIDLLAKGRAGRRRRADTRLCTPCKRQVHKHGVTVGHLANRDGLVCHICGEEVDLAAQKPDPFRPSIDHRKPRSMGGDDSPENLALTHLWCNQVKSNREGFVI